MELPIKKDIIHILREALRTVKSEDIAALIELSNHAIKDASIFQDKDSIQIAIVIYALSKIIPRSDVKVGEWDKIKKSVLTELENARFYLEKEKEDKYRLIIKTLLKKIGELDDKLKLYIDDVLDKAKIVKGSKIYEQGISLERAADLLGVSQWELMSYVGKTKIIDRYDEDVLPVKKRINFAKKLFRI